MPSSTSCCLHADLLHYYNVTFPWSPCCHLTHYKQEINHIPPSDCPSLIFSPSRWLYVSITNANIKWTELNVSHIREPMQFSWSVEMYGSPRPLWGDAMVSLVYTIMTWITILTIKSMKHQIQSCQSIFMRIVAFTFTHLNLFTDSK